MAVLISDLDIDNAKHIDLYHPGLGTIVHVDVYRDQPIRILDGFWQQDSHLVYDWFTTTILCFHEVYSRTTWHPTMKPVEGVQRKWDHTIDRLESMLAAYVRSGYEIKDVEYEY